MSAAQLGVLALLTPSLTTITATLTALVGAFVAYQGYRGYRRNDSKPMFYLALGILLLTTVPFVVRQVVLLSNVGGAASGEFAALTVSVVGLLAVLYSFTGA